MVAILSADYRAKFDSVIHLLPVTLSSSREGHRPEGQAC